MVPRPTSQSVGPNSEEVGGGEINTFCIFPGEIKTIYQGPYNNDHHYYDRIGFIVFQVSLMVIISDENMM